MGSNIYTKNNHIICFGPDLLNTISYIATLLKYITLIMNNKYQNIKKRKN